MHLRIAFRAFAKTTIGRRTLLLICALTALTLNACGAKKDTEVEHVEEAALSRTEFTERVENFFEYDPLIAGEPSEFLIHLTDLADGTPIEKAEVTVVARKKGGEVAQTKARVGKVTGIYVAEVVIPAAGDYDIEFHIKNPKIDERMLLTNFKVE